MEYHYIQLPKFIETVEEIKTDEEAWIGYISNQLNKEELEEIFKMKRSIEEIDEIVKAVLEDKDVNDELNRRIYNQYDKLAALQYAEEKGEKRGEEKGERKKAIQLAKLMLKDGKDIEEIQKYTGLTKEELDEINN